MPGDILCIVLGQNGTTYLTMTGKENQTTHGILSVITIIIFKCSKETSKVSQLANFTINLKRQQVS